VILIIDGNNMAYRALHTQHLSYKGKDTSITYGCSRMLYALIKRHRPASVIVCFDGGTPAFRRGLVPTYKAHRKKSDDIDWDAVYRQIDELHTVWGTFGILTLRAKGMEADDLMYHAAKMVYGRPYIVTTDDDLLQAVNQRINVINPSKGKIITLDNFEKEIGVKPDLYLLYKTLVGDSSDGIPGVKSIGPKTAAKLIWVWGDGGVFFDNRYTAALNKRQHKNLIKCGEDRFWDMYDCMDLSIDRVGAHKVITNASWMPAHTVLIKSYAKRNGFMSLLEMGGEYTSAFAGLKEPKFDNIRHPITELRKEPVSGR
jgi:5'-3' exonuclease